jgi:hypothetical protein
MDESIWYDIHAKALYTGFTGLRSNFSGAGPSNPVKGLWKFSLDDIGGGTWSQLLPNSDNDSGVQLVVRPFQAAVAANTDTAYILGGVETAYNDPSTVGLKGEVALSGLVQYNMTDQTFSNVSASGFSSYGTFQNGNLHWISAVGPNGIFIAMGGGIAPNGKYIPGSDLQSFETVSILDPVTGTWYHQQTSGIPPAPRLDFCVTSATASDSPGYHEV